MSVSVPSLSPAEFGAMLASARAAAAALQRPITPSEHAALPREPRTAVEFMAFAELSFRKTLGAFQLIRDFAALSHAHQMTLIQARRCCLLPVARRRGLHAYESATR